MRMISSTLPLGLLLAGAASAEPRAVEATLEVSATPRELGGEVLVARLGGQEARSGGRPLRFAPSGAWMELLITDPGATEGAPALAAWVLPLPGHRYRIRVNPCSGYEWFDLDADSVLSGEIRVELVGADPMELHADLDRIPLQPGLNPPIPLTVSGMCPGAAQDLVISTPGADRYDPQGVRCRARIHLAATERVVLRCDPATGVVGVRSATGEAIP